MGPPAPSKLRQPTQYASPPRQPKFSRSISNTSDDTSDSDSCVFPRQLMQLHKTAKKRYLPRSKARAESTDDEDTFHMIPDRLPSVERELKAKTEHMLDLEEMLAAERATNATLRAQLQAAEETNRDQLDKLTHTTLENEQLRRDMTRLQDEYRRNMIDREDAWTKQQDRLRQLQQAYRDVESQLDDCFAALHAWKEQAKQADSSTRCMWQERLEMEYNLVRETAQSNQTKEREARMDELKVLQKIRAVSQSVFVDETTPETPPCRRRSLACLDDSLDKIDMKDPLAWIDTWAERQTQRHQDSLAWLNDLDQRMHEDSRRFVAALTAEDASSFVWRIEDEDDTLREIDVLLSTWHELSIEDSKVIMQVAAC